MSKFIEVTNLEKDNRKELINTAEILKVIPKDDGCKIWLNTVVSMEEKLVCTYVAESYEKISAELINKSTIN